MRITVSVFCFFLALASCSRTEQVHVYPADDLCEAVSLAAASAHDAEIILHEGEYRLGKGMAVRGHREGRLTIKAAPGERPVIRGDIAPTLHQDPGNEKIYHADLTADGISDFGCVTGKYNRFELYCNGLRQIPSRWPDDHYARAGKVLGKTKRTEVVGIIAPDADVFSEGIFECDAPRLDLWKKESCGAIHAFPRFNWNDSPLKILSAGKGIVHVDSTDARYGFKNGFRYYAYNLLCEMDRPGEYHIDTETGHLTWMVPSGFAPGQDEVSIPVFNGPYLMEICGSDDVHLEGLEFRGARNGAVLFSGSGNVSMEKCRVSGFGTDAVVINDCKDVRVERCLIEHCGLGGILSKGGDRNSLEPAGYVFEGNVVRHFSELRYTYHSGIRFTGCGAKIAGNELYDCPSVAIGIGGNDITIEKNHFHDLACDGDDQGALDIYGNYYFRGIVVRDNLWENITGEKGAVYGAAAIRLDDMISGMEIHGNHFRNCGGGKFGAVQIHGGKDNLVEENIFENCATAVSFSPWDEEKWIERTADGKHWVSTADSVKTGDPLYLERYPALRKDINEGINRNYILNNTISDCGRLFFRENGNNVVEGNIIKSLEL